MVRSADNATDQQLSALEHACRGVVGDRLRSVSVDGPEYSGTIYRRSDLAPGTDGPVHEAMAAGASCEVFADGGRRVSSSAGADGGRRVSPSAAADGGRRVSGSAGADGGRRASPSAGADGGRTVCEFDNGYVARMQIGDTTVVATTDGLKMDRESELSAAVRGVFE